jgi:hypothetical protein
MALRGIRGITRHSWYYAAFAAFMAFRGIRGILPLGAKGVYFFNLEKINIIDIKITTSTI